VTNQDWGCPCGNPFILADTEDWEIPLCNSCYEEWLQENQPNLADIEDDQ
jgi:hypothetical protein